MARHVVAGVDEVPPGGRKRAEVHGREIAIFNIGGEFFEPSYLDFIFTVMEKYLIYFF